MEFREEKLKNAKKIFTIFASIIGICSLLLFIPQIRELIICFGEKLLGRPLTHEVWHNNFIKWEVVFLLLLLSVILFLFKRREIESFVAKETFLNILSISIVIISSAVFIMIACQSNDVWLDETFSLGLAQHSVKDLISITAQDVHPPLYYLILKIAMLLFPGSVTAAKIVSAIPIILILCTSHLFFSKEFSCKYSILFNLLLLSSYSVRLYAVEIRMYSWCMFFCAACCICSYYIVKKGNLKYFILYVLFAELGAYCHYWIAFCLAINFMLISALYSVKNKKSVQNVFIAAGLGIVLYLPWAGIVIKQVSAVSKSYWIEPITLKTFFSYFTSMIPMNGIMKAVSILLLLVCLKNCVYGIRRKNLNALFYVICLSTPVLLILSATAISLIMRPVFLTRYVFPISIFTVFFITFTCTEYKLKKGAFIFLAIVTLCCSGINIKNAYQSEKKLGQEKEAFENLMQENLFENTVFIFGENVDGQIPRVLAYLYPKNRIYNFEIGEMWSSAILYNRKNFIKTLDDESNICYVINLDDEPDNDFKDYPYYVANIGWFYKPLKFYFVEK